jgi:hypothetical protein
VYFFFFLFSEKKKNSWPCLKEMFRVLPVVKCYFVFFLGIKYFLELKSSDQISLRELPEVANCFMPSLIFHVSQMLKNIFCKIIFIDNIFHYKIFYAKINGI